MGLGKFWTKPGNRFAAGLIAVAALAACSQGIGPKSDKAGADGARPDAVADGAAGPAAAPGPEALGPAASAEVQALFEGEFEAVGAEPFWQMDLLADAVSFRRPGLEDVVEITQPRAYRAQGMQVQGGPLTVRLKAGACVHTSGETFAYLATVFFDGVAYEGCARRASGAGGATPTWAFLLPELIPAIDKCLERATAKPARVTIGYVVEQAQTTVRLLGSDGGRYECAVSTETGEIEYFEPIGDRDVVQGERDPLFSRAPTEAPAGQCWRSEPALSPTGEQLGWLSRKTC